MTAPPSFDLLAPAYHFLERITYGRLLHWCRTAHLNRMLDSRRALILGDGDGRFLADLLCANSQILVDSLDVSPGMLRLARQRISNIPGAADRVHFIHADARSYDWSDTRYDLIVTNFFLDCFTAGELERLIERLAGISLPGAIWVGGDFRVPVGSWGRRVAKMILAGMYLFFAITTRVPAHTLTDPAPFLTKSGFALALEESRLRGFLSSRLWVKEQSKTPALRERTSGSKS
jgi:SAM-dependent methyltransferase